MPKNTKLYKSLLAKGMSEADALEIVGQHTPSDGTAARVKDTVDELARLAKGGVTPESVADMRKSFDAAQADAEAVVDAISEASDKSLSETRAGQAALAKGLKVILEGQQSINERLGKLEGSVAGIDGDAIRKSIADAAKIGSEPAVPASTRPGDHNIQPHPGDAGKDADGNAVLGVHDLGERLSQKVHASDSPSMRKSIQADVSDLFAGKANRADLMKKYDITA